MIADTREYGDAQRLLGPVPSRVGATPVGSTFVRRMAPPLLAFLATCAVFIPFARLGIDSHHDGVMLKPALDVLSGQRLFGDTFSQYGALTTYIQVFFLWAMGKSLLSLKVGTVLTYALTASVLSLAWRRFLPSTLVTLSLAVCLFLPDFFDYSRLHIFLPWSSVYAMLFQAAGLLFLLRTVDGSSMLDPFLCGASAALVTCCRMPTGVFHTAACVAFLAFMLYAGSDRRRYAMAAAGFLGGLLLIHGLFFAHLWATGSVVDWYLQNVRLPRLFAQHLSNVAPKSGLSRILDISKTLFRSLFAFDSFDRSSWIKLGLEKFAAALMAAPLVAMIVVSQLRGASGRPGVDDRRASAAWILVPMLSFSVLAAAFMADVGLGPWVIAVPVVTLTWLIATAIRCVRRPGPHGGVDGRTAAALACGFLGLASWLQYYPVAEARHFFWALMPMIGPFAYFLFLAARGRVLTVTLALLMLAIPLWATRIVQAAGVARARFVTIPGNSVLGGMAVPEAEAANWSALLDAVDRKLEEDPDVPFLAEGDDPLYGTLVHNLRNPTPFYVEWGLKGNWPAFGGQHTANYPRMRDSFRDTYSPLVYILYHARKRLSEYQKKYGYNVIFEDRDLDMILLSRSRPRSPR